MHTWTTGHFLQMLHSPGGIAMREHQVAGIAFAPDLELIASSGLAPTFIQFFVGDMLAVKVLANKDLAGLNVLSVLLDAKSVIAGGQGHKKRRTSTSQGIENTQ